jgi:hypothetical protein
MAFIVEPTAAYSPTIGTLVAAVRGFTASDFDHPSRPLPRASAER